MEAIDHGVQVSLLWGFHGRCGRTVGGEFKDRVLRVVFFHGVEVVGAFEQVGALTRGVFGADGLAVDALC